MIKAEELRLGNLVYDTSGKVNTINLDAFKYLLSYGGTDICQVKPIPLTEEWLLKFGFEFKNTPREYGWLKSVLNREICWCHSKEISLEFKSGQYDEYTNTLLDIDCQYVHQLQNLYFALTGEELKIND